MIEEKFYTIEQVAEMLNVHRTTVYDWMRSGDLAFVQVGGRRRITGSALNAFIKQGKPEELKEDSEERYSPALLAA
jgi:excisionase family DNA binding protein